MKSLLPVAIALTGAVGILSVLYPDTMLSPGALSAGHRDLGHDCFACHQPFRGTPQDRCIACHKPEEIGVDKALPDSPAVGFHRLLARVACTACHSDHQGLQAGGSALVFDHAMLPAGTVANCLNCHEVQRDPLHDALASNSCKDCHGFTAWKEGARFRHDLLLPARAKSCVSCHAAPTDALHREAKDCATCHATTAWKPATFEHSRYFVLDRDHRVSCDICHRGGDYGKYTCYGCHEHSPGRILAEHREEGITRKLDDCVTCHRSASEHEGGEGRGGSHHGEHGDDED